MQESVETIKIEFEERLRFEQLLSDISSRFVNILPDRVNPEINRALKEVLDFFRVDRVGLLQVHPRNSSFRMTHVASAENLPPVPVGLEVPQSLYPWSYNKVVQEREVLSLHRLDDLPAGANVDRQSYIREGVRSTLDIPVLIAELVGHVIVMQSNTNERLWPEQFIPRLRLLGEIFVNTLERKQIRLEIEERLRFERLLSVLSARFINLAPDQMDSEVEDAQRRICELLDLDRSALWQISEQGIWLLTHIQPRPSIPRSEWPDARVLFPRTTGKLLAGETVTISRIADLPGEAALDRESFDLYGTKSTVLVPLSTGGGKPLGVLSFASMRQERDWPETVVKGFQLIAQVFANALARKRMENQLRDRLQEIEELKQRLERENICLQEEVKHLVKHGEIVGQSLAMKKVLSQAELVARTDSTVLIQGETGTGKELLARAIHKMSSRKDQLLITINCASLPPTLIESELFGREKGAYTGALSKMIGRFEIADGSTLFLDEIGELPLDLQSKLLRVLEAGNFERLGSTKTLQVNVRIIAATNRDLDQEVKDGKFRKDLFYRLNVFPMMIPPLRERPEDIPLMVWAFVKEFQRRMGEEIESISKKSIEALQSYSWPGNVRELRNVVEHAMILSKSKTLVVHAPKLRSSETDSARNLEDMERRHIVAVLEKTGWRAGGKVGAAEILGLKRTTLYGKMKKLGIKRSNKAMSK